MGHDVFISHAATDKVIADAITNSLESGGVRCWVAPRDIRPGDTWGGSIVKAIENCSIMVVLFSESSNKSRQVLREVERAVQKNVVVLPFRIEDIEPTGDMEYFLSATHWLDALVGDMEMHYKHLLQTTLSILEREALEADPPKAEPAKPITPPEPAEPAEAKPVEKAAKKVAKKANKKTTKRTPRIKAEPLIEKQPEIKKQPIPEPLANQSPVIENTPSPKKGPEALETPSQMEWASALEADHEKKSNNKSDASLINNPGIDNDGNRATARDPRLKKTGLHTAPELMIEGARNRREADQTKSPSASKKWLLVAASAIPIIAVGAWFLFNDKPLDSEGNEPVTAVEKRVDTTESKKNTAKNTAQKEITKEVAETKIIPTKSKSKSTPKVVKKPSKEPRPITIKERKPNEQPKPDAKKGADTPKRLTQEQLGEIARQKAEQEKAQREKAEAQRLAAKQAAAEKAHNALIAKAEGGDIGSQLKLAQMYQNGEGAQRSATQAERWFAKAAEAGSAEAQFELSQILANSKGGQQNQGAAISWLIKAADQDNLLAQTQLAERYSSGSGVGQSDIDAVQWYRRAANLGDLEAQKNLATFYEFGIGTNKDLAAALKWYNAAANQGDRSSKLYVQKLLEKDPSLNRPTNVSPPNTSSTNSEANNPPSS